MRIAEQWLDENLEGCPIKEFSKMACIAGFEGLTESDVAWPQHLLIVQASKFHEQCSFNASVHGPQAFSRLLDQSVQLREQC